MIGINRRGRINLQTIVVFGRVLKETVHWIEHFVREEEEPFARYSAVVEAFFAFKRQEEFATQVVWMQLCYL